MSIPTKLILSLAAALGGGITKKYYTDQEWIGVAFGIISVVFLCNPFA